MRGPLRALILTGRGRNYPGWCRLIRWLTMAVATLTACMPPGAMAAEALPAVALVATTDAGELSRYCGAVAIGPRTLLTARHCLRGKTAVRYVTQELWEGTSDGAYMATTMRQSEGRDLAWLRVQGPAFATWLPMRGPREGETLRTVAPIAGWAVDVGFAGIPFRAVNTPELLMPFHDEAPEDPAGAIGQFWSSSLSIQPGWSGSPVLGVDGALVGLVIACAKRIELVPMTDGLGWTYEQRCRPNYTIIAPLGP